MESTQKRNMIVGQSGGPTAVINASLYGVLKEGLSHPDRIGTVYGMVHGIEGFLEGDYINLTERAQIERIQSLKTTPGAYLGSCRYKLPEDLNDDVYPRLFEKFNVLGIGYFFYIGGNDSMDTVAKLSAYAQKVHSDIRFIGIPKTIDNDLIETDHTPGYGSTAKYVATTVREISLDAGVYKHPVVTIIELMGRNAGWVTAASALARTKADPNPLLIYLPESDFDTERFIEDIRTAFERSTSVIVCVSEGISDKDGKLICEYGAEAQVDNFGHKMLTGCGKVLENLVKSRLHCKCRSIELNLPQRCSGIIASQTDIEEASSAGSFAVQSALDGATGKMVAFRRTDSEDGLTAAELRRGASNGYRIQNILVDVAKVCNQEKRFPDEWITSHGTDVSKEFLQYVRPLIQGESAVSYRDGLPVYMHI